MASKIVVTDVGRAEILNATQTGTDAVKLTQVAFGLGKYEASADMTELQSEIKRLDITSGKPVDSDIISFTVLDKSKDSYTAYEFGVFTESGTLFAVYSQTTPIVQKSSSSQSTLAVDIKLVDISASSVTFGDASFLLPPATEEVQGVVELATEEETIAGTDKHRAVTPAALKTLTATTTRAGLVELATIEEAIAGTGAQRAVTPAGLAARTATTERSGLVRVAGVEDETNCQCDDAAITPANFADMGDYRQASTSYSAGDVVRCMYHAELYLQCTTAGKTSANALDTKSVTAGQSITDGTVVWSVVKNITTANGDFLPLSGGTMTGAITLRKGDNSIVAPTDDYYIEIEGCTKCGNGAKLTLYGQDCTNYQGWFNMSAISGDNKRHLVGKPDGTLTWGAKGVFLAPNYGGKVSLSSSTLTGGYNAPSMGIVYAYGWRDGGWNLAVNGTSMTAVGSSATGACTVLVNKGDVVKMSHAPSGYYGYFVPCSI